MLIWQQARQDARDVLSAYWHEEAYPVDPERVAEAMGMVVDRRPVAREVSGMLHVAPDEPPVIYVDDHDVWQRQQFTIAHEIGHYYERVNFGEQNFNFIDRRGGPYDGHEFYADEFAGNLLMPEEEVKRQVNSGRGTAQIAHHFDVSLPAITMRIRRLSDRQLL